MPVKYIDVTASSDLFVPATRAFGDIAIVGKGRASTPASRPAEFTNPAAAIARYPVTPTVTDAVLDSTTTVTSAIAGFVASDVGRSVTGTGIPAGTTIASVTSATTIVLSAAATATATGVTLTFSPTRSVKDAVLDSTPTVTSATAEFAASEVGSPVTGTGIPAGTTIASVTSATTIVLSAAATATATGVALTFGPGLITDLAAAIAIAFRQTPPPTRVWGVQVDAASPDWAGALAEVANLNVQIVALANMPLNSGNATVIGSLATHVATVSNTGGDGKERIGVAMLDPTLTAATAVALNTGAVKNERMFLIAHTSAEDAGAAAAGVIAGYEPQISMLLKPIKINMTRLFSDADIDAFDGAFINWVTSPVLIPGQSLFLGEGYTADPSQNKKYIDIVRTIDDINFRIKAELIQAIGNFRVSRSGLRGIVTLVQAVLSPQVAADVIEDFSIHIPLLVLLDKDPTTLSAAELTEIQQAQANRLVDMVVTVVYAGAIHRLHIDLVFQ